MTVRFIRYPKESLGYYFYLPKNHNVIVSQHAKFKKKRFYLRQRYGKKIQFEKSISEEQRVIEPKEPIPPRRSTRISHPPERYMGMLEEDVEKIFLIDDMDHVDDPKIYDEAMSDIESEKQLKVMRSEID